MRIVLGVELLRRRIDVGRVHPLQRTLGLGLRRDERHVDGHLDFFLDLRLDRLDLRLGGNALFEQPLRERRHGVAPCLILALTRRLVEDFVVG